jgi:hypothetical protein
MSFNILGAIVHGAESFVMSGGNPIAGGIGAVEGGLSQNASASQPPGLGDAQAQTLDLLSEINMLSNFAKSGSAN